MAKPKQGAFLEELKRRPEPQVRNKFSWEQPIAKPPSEARLKGNPKVAKSLASPTPAPTPTTFDGKIDQAGIKRDLTRTVRAQTKKELKR